MARFRENYILHYHIIRWTTALVVVFSVYSSIYYAIVGRPGKPQKLQTAAQVVNVNEKVSHLGKRKVSHPKFKKRVVQVFFLPVSVFRSLNR